jgi:hypothetical protein
MDQILSKKKITVKKDHIGFNIEKRMRITITSESGSLATALNEALIVTSRPAKMLRFSILVDKVWSLAKPPVVFRVVPAGFGDIIAQRQVHLVAHLLLVVDIRLVVIALYTCG